MTGKGGIFISKNKRQKNTAMVQEKNYLCQTISI